MRRIMARCICAVTAILLALSLAGCGSGSTPEAVWPGDRADAAEQGTDTAVTRKTSYPAYTAKDGTWAIYMYICGSNLESYDSSIPMDGYGMASMDVSEVEAVALPDGVTVVMELGGADNWQGALDPGVLNRRVHDADGPSDIAPAKLSNMGDPNTLAEFLEFCNTEYPAEHQIVILWDHGGGSLFGYGSDELFNHDELSLPELNAAFDAAPAASGKYEIIGFDACLMATIDVVAVLQDDANYLVASEELESGAGWDYTGALEALAANTRQTTAEFATAICDSFYQFYLDLNRDYPDYNMYQEATLSVVDLNKADMLLEAYRSMADESLLLAVERKEEYLSAFARAARASENYGYNTPENGFFEMVDMGDLARNAAELLPESRSKVEAALAECVVYQVKGPLRSKASGVSCYYCYSGDPKSVAFYNEAGSSKAVGYYHEYSTSGALSQEGLQYVSGIGTENNQPAPEPETLQPTENLGLADFPVTLGRDGHWQLDIGPDRAKSVAAVYNYMLWDNGTDSSGVALQVLFGVSNEVDADWQNGVFTERYTGMWGCIDDAQVYMRAVSYGDGYVLYSCPVLLNGVLHSLFVSLEYDATDREEYTILGVRKATEDAVRSMANKEPAPKEMAQLQPDDVLEPIHYFLTREGSEEWKRDGFSVQTITLGENPRFSEKSLGDGHFKIMFCVVDYAGNEYLSQAGDYKVKEGRVERVQGWSVYRQPDRAIKGISLAREQGASGVCYTTILEPGAFDANWQALQLPGYASTYTIEVFTREDGVDLDAYVGERTVYLQGGFMDGRGTHNYDMVFEVTGIMAGEGGLGGENPSGTLAGGASMGGYSESEELVLNEARAILSYLKNGDWGALGHSVHPKQGLTFSPYGYVDTDTAVKLGPGDVIALASDRTERTWGHYDGSGEPIKMTFSEYFDRFIFDRDFTEAPEAAVDRIIKTGFESNLYVFGNGGAFVEFHFPGTEPDAEFDWASLRLVFSWYEGDDTFTEGLYLVAIVHDSWGV